MAAVDPATVRGDGGHEDYTAPIVGLHVWDGEFGEEEGGT